MPPRLVAVDGLLIGKDFVLSDEEVSIGRSPANTIVIPEAAVSRRHCIIKKEGGEFRLTDLDSMHGTRVNGQAVTTCFLGQGDRIRIGPVNFVFFLEDDDHTSTSRRMELQDVTLTAKTTIQLEPSDALHLQPGRLLESISARGRLIRDLNSLLRVAAAVSTVHGVEPLAQRLLDLAFDAIPAEHGGVLIVDRHTGDIEPVCVRSKEKDSAQPFAVSRTLIQYVLRKKVAVWSTDVVADEEWRQVKSLVTARIQSVLCAPLSVMERVIGALYIDTTDPAFPFDENHLHLLTAIAGIASAPIEQAQRVEWLENENARLAAETQIASSMIGDGPAMKEIYRSIARVAHSDSTVLIRGESGTGKELAARAIHLNSPRADKPFVAINCAALAEQLLESELFGHEKGAFTGAIARKIGKFEVADEGTIFLDEIGEMSPAVQLKLLRVLQEREFERVGATRPVRVDIRVVAATNRDLEKEIGKGAFRQDLYYRLNVVPFTMPSLRERREDIPLLAGHFCALYAKKVNRIVTGISPEARECLLAYDWPGNVRELQNVIERAVVMGLDDLIRPEDLPDALVESKPEADKSSARYVDAVNEAKRQLILRALDQAGGVITEAAKSLGLNSNYLHRLMKNLKVKRPIS